MTVIHDVAPIHQFWGKARPIAGAAATWHPLWKHALDVAAVGDALARAHPRLHQHLAARLGWPVETLIGLWRFALALHDLGKFTRPFQAKSPDHWPAALLGPRPDRLNDPGHPTTGLQLLLRYLADDFAAKLPSWSPKQRRLFFAPALGHHGRPVDPDAELAGHEVVGAPSVAAARAFFAMTAELLSPPAPPAPVAAALTGASWTLAGLAVLADWIGSNQAYFPYDDVPEPPAVYWTRARAAADRAVAEIGLSAKRVAEATGYAALFGTAQKPSGLQRWAENVALPDGPALCLIEDQTGAGKTEAALILAHRMMAAGQARGLYLALPTMATAGAMYRRLGRAYRRLFNADERPSLALMHGRSDLDPIFQASVVPSVRTRPVTKHGDEEADSAGECPAWLSDDRRRAMLADIGVGTIDQAFLGVLPVKYQGLRLLGLGEKALIVDEAHAYDAYMGEELDSLLAFQAMLGAPAIVLSATLPLARRQKLADAFAAGLGVAAAQLTDTAYPCAAQISAESAAVEAISPRPDLARSLKVTRVADPAAALTRIAEASAAGAAVAWVRNTVDDALAARDLLAGQGIAAGLFHARFAMADRLAVERDTLARYGRDGDAIGRRGAVLVATQVAEQSLDLDFDLLVSDLAPIDLLLQRAGRLWRHPRRPRPIAGPELIVLSPDPAETVNANWIKAAMPGTAAVYRDPAILYLTARTLFGREPLRLPEETRALIEGVYGAVALAAVPDAFDRQRLTVEGESKAAIGQARDSLLIRDRGYALDNRFWQSEQHVQTRLGDPVQTFRLALAEGGGLKPWAEDADPARAWALSEVTLRKNRAASAPAPAGLADAVARLVAGWPRYEATLPVLVLQPDDDGTWTGQVRDLNDRPINIRYSTETGLRFA